jgi:hypothetical protein
MAASNPIATIASAAADPSGTKSKTGMMARVTVFGRAPANIWRTGQDPSAESDPVGTGALTRRRCGTYREPSYISSCLAAGSKQPIPAPSTTPPVVAAHVIIGAGIPASTRPIKLRVPNVEAKRHARPSAGTESTRIACHFAVDGPTGNAAVQE